jgi:hypothetical protein
LTVAQLRDVVAKILAQIGAKPLNLNFFCDVRERDAAVEASWLKRLAPYYAEFGVDPPAFPATIHPPFDAEMCDVVVELKPEVVSFHFGLPGRVLVNRIVREVGPLANDVSSFPLGALALEPLRKKAESEGSADFTGLTAGEAAPLCRELPAGELTLKLAAETLHWADRE